jgi:hypothetical protein
MRGQLANIWPTASGGTLVFCGQRRLRGLYKQLKQPALWAVEANAVNKRTHQRCSLHG